MKLPIKVTEQVHNEFFLCRNYEITKYTNYTYEVSLFTTTATLLSCL